MSLNSIVKIVFLLIAACSIANGQGYSETKLLASDGAGGDRFGLPVAISGDRVVAGAMLDDDNGNDSGSAYIYDYNGSTWIETKLIASDGAAGDSFGFLISVSGDRVVVGARLDDDNGSNSGSAYIYDYDGNSWVETKLTASDGAAGDEFGASLSVSGDRVIVGAKGDDGYIGSAYIYDYNGSSWVETKLTASDGAVSDAFGSSVSMSQDRVIVAAIGDDDNGSNSGSVYIYDYDGSAWVETKLTASDGSADDYFGWSVSVSGDRVIVGAEGDGDNGFNSGSAYIYEYNGTTWIETKLVASDAAAFDAFGWYVSFSGDIAIVGAKGDDDNGSYSGSAYIFNWDGSDWAETKLVASDGAANDGFGFSVSVSGNKTCVGAFKDDDNGNDSGSIYIHELTLLNYYEDADGDTFGDSLNTIVAITPPTGYVVDNTDCDDTDPTIYPGAVELCDGLDNDCDGIIENLFVCNCTSGIQANTFLGNSTYWNDAVNWSLGTVPTLCDAVLIPAGLSCLLLSTESGECYTLEVQQVGDFQVEQGAVLDVIAPGN